MSSSSTAEDVEKGRVGSDYAHLNNDEVKSFGWADVTVTVKDRTSQQPIDLLSNVSGMVEAGEMMALMGPRYVHSMLTQITYRHLTENIQWLRKDNSSQHPRPPRRNTQGHHSTDPPHKWRLNNTNCIPQIKFLRRAGRCANRLAHCPRNTLLRCSTGTPKFDTRLIPQSPDHFPPCLLRSHRPS
jgi:hypothetical protein